MANRRLYQFLYSRQPKLTMVNGIISFGANGSVTAVSSVGVYTATNLATGQYQIKLTDNYYAFVGAQFNFYSGISAVSAAVAGLTGSSMYQITAVGNTDWSGLGPDPDYTVAAGTVFRATATVGSGTGTAKLLTVNPVVSAQVMQSQVAALQNNNPSMGRGSSVFFQTVAPAVTTAQTSTAVYVSTATMAATNPVASSSMSFKLWFRDSSVTP